MTASKVREIEYLTCIISSDQQASKQASVLTFNFFCFCLNQDDEGDDLSKQPRGDRDVDVELPQDPTDSELPEIDVSDCMRQIDNKNAQMDQGLVEMSKRVQKLKEIAVNMNNVGFSFPFRCPFFFPVI